MSHVISVIFLMFNMLPYLQSKQPGVIEFSTVVVRFNYFLTWSKKLQPCPASAVFGCLSKRRKRLRFYRSMKRNSPLSLQLQLCDSQQLNRRSYDFYGYPYTNYWWHVGFQPAKTALHLGFQEAGNQVEPEKEGTGTPKYHIITPKMYLVSFKISLLTTVKDITL